MGFWSSVGAAVFSVASSISSAVSSVVSKAKEVATKAIGFMAEKAEGFIGKVSQMWQRIKPHIANGRKILQVLGGFITHPWVKVALVGLDRALAWLEKLDKQPLVKRLQKALEWVISWCKDAHQKNMEEQELAEFSDADTMRLDELTQRQFGKPIIPFVFEEMIIAWEKSRQLLEEEWEKKNSALAKDQLLHNRLVRAQKYEELEPTEVSALNDLKITLPRDTADLEQLGDDLQARRSYVNAAEGFLQMLEKEEQQLIAEGKEYLLDQGATVGALLIDCSQNDRAWSSLSLEEQSLITDFANIFGADCQKRTETGLLVEVMA